ncbi:MFS transporter [Streptomyces sp. OE57]|uniref:MFS transporter n=1 Tax=Streptomyces lacaronensis TaxID=3379885 RepID=UPI0039B7659D
MGPDLRAAGAPPTDTDRASRRASGFPGVYRGLLSTAEARRLATASAASKFPVSMFPVTTLLLVSPRYSYAAAGLTLGTMQLASAASNPMRARLVTRHSLHTVLMGCLVGYLMGLGGLAASVTAHLPLAALLLAAMLTGLCFPPVGILTRTHWMSVTSRGSLPVANALEATLMDIALIVGPVLASLLSTAVSPAAPLAAIGALMAGAVVQLAAVHRLRPPGPVPHSGQWARIARARPLLVVFAAQFLFCAVLAATEVALPISAQQHDAAARSGWYLGALSVGSIVGSLTLGATRARRMPGLAGLLSGFAVGVLVLGLALRADPPLVLAGCLGAGVAVGSSFAGFYTRIGELTPKGCDNEAQSLASSMMTVGFAVGASAGASLSGAYGASAVLCLLFPVATAVAVLPTLTDAPSARTR